MHPNAHVTSETPIEQPGLPRSGRRIQQSTTPVPANPEAPPREAAAPAVTTTMWVNVDWDRVEPDAPLRPRSGRRVHTSRYGG